MATAYKYTIRPGDESNKILIEFLSPPQDKDFIKQVIRAFKSINIQVINYDDLWMNDEIVLNALSDIGGFTIYRDRDGIYFLMAEDNKVIIFHLDTILSGNPLFDKVL